MGADAFNFHLNPLQEAIQPEGDRNFANLIPQLREMIPQLKAPVLVKEVGSGISETTAKKLKTLSLAGIETAGAGGTSWSKIESLRTNDATQRSTGALFARWGIPTAESVAICRKEFPSLVVISSGGMRNGIEIAKAIALGADAGALALPILKAAEKSVDDAVQAIEAILTELRTAMFVSGISSIKDLKTRGPSLLAPRERLERLLVDMGKAHAKVILVGEHFVVPSVDARGNAVSGSAAVAIPLPGLHTEVRLTPSTSVSCELDSESEEQGFTDGATDLMEKALRLAANRFQWDLAEKPLHIYSSSNFPASRGLGSSASFSVALTRAFKRLSAKQCDVRTEAQQLENLFHGKSSGLDTSTIAGDAAILFRNGEILRTFHPAAADIVVADSGPRDSCSTLVSRMMELRRSKPELWNSLANQISDLSHRCVEELSKSTGGRGARANHQRRAGNSRTDRPDERSAGAAAQHRSQSRSTGRKAERRGIGRCRAFHRAQGRRA